MHISMLTLGEEPLASTAPGILVAVNLTDWGEPANLIALAGLLATIGLAVAAWRGKARGERRAQAELVTGWCERRHDHRVVAMVRNGSTLQINDVLLHVSRPSSADARAPMPLSSNASGDIHGQTIAVESIPPERTVAFPVDLSRLGPDVRPTLVMYFKDVRGRPWVRDHRGQLSSHSDDQLSAHLFGGGLTHGHADVFESAQDDIEAPANTPVSRLAYSTQLMSRAAGNQLRLAFVPPHVDVEVAAGGQFFTGEKLVLSVDFDASERLVSLTLYNLEDIRRTAAAIQMWDMGQDTLRLHLASGTFEELLPRVTQVIRVPLPRGGEFGELCLNSEGPLLMRLVDARRRLHPEFLADAHDQ